MHKRVAFIALGLAFLAAGTGDAQESRTPAATGAGRILGRILDAETSQPVPDVAVRITDLDRPARVSNADGWFEITDVPRGIYEIEIQHIAYGSKRQLVNVPAGRTVELEVRLNPEPLALDPIEVEVQIRSPGLERRGFYDRQRSGWGRYFTREDFERWDMNQVLRQVPGLQLRPVGRSTLSLVPIFRRGYRSCVPNLFIDGVRIRFFGDGIDALVDPVNIAAMEVYRGVSTPMEFLGPGLGAPCGAIVIWTRSGNAY